MKKIIYRIDTATEVEISAHLFKCNGNFIPPLSEKVNIKDYARKLALNSVTFEAWSHDILAGVVAAYFNDINNKTGYITNVSTLGEFFGQGLGSKLLKMCIDYGEKNGYRQIMLEVNSGNENAIGLYKKNGFGPTTHIGDMIGMKKELSFQV
ncbi:MAG: GNAT family N-acetyltransferase [Ferruginibacter sp.]